jgi:4-amino-4-deoxychorismate lyase
MYRLIETIRVENRSLQQVSYHNKRFNEARRALFGSHDRVDIEEIVHIPTELPNTVFKLRLLTNGSEFEQELVPYLPRLIRTVKLVYNNSIEYTYKTEDRQSLDRAFAQRGHCDDVMIVKNGLISDSFATNILFFDGTEWHTPKTPLLRGTQREFLLDQKRIVEKEIKVEDLQTYRSLKLINAMIDFECATELQLPDCLVL